MNKRIDEQPAQLSRGASWFSGISFTVLLMLAWCVTRAVLMASTLTGEIPTDVSAYARWANELSSDISPASDSAYVYPPGALGLFLLLDVFPPELYYRGFTVFALLADLLIFVLIWLRVRSGTPWQVVAPWAWVVMGFAAGPLLYQRYDVFAALFTVLAVLAVNRPVWAGVWSGIGLLLKLWPEIALLGLSKRALWRGVASNIAVVFGGWIALHVMTGDSLGFVRNVLNKGLSVEATAAFPFLIMRSMNGTHGVTGQFGSWEVVGPGVDMAATLTTMLGIALLIGILVLRLAGRLENTPPGDVVLLGVLIFVATHKINSLQYGVWIAAATAVALTFRGSRAQGPALLLTLMLFATDQVIWDNFVPFISGNPFLLMFQGLRLALLLAALSWIAWPILKDVVSRQERTGSLE